MGMVSQGSPESDNQPLLARVRPPKRTSAIHRWWGPVVFYLIASVLNLSGKQSLVAVEIALGICAVWTWLAIVTLHWVSSMSLPKKLGAWIIVALAVSGALWNSVRFFTPQDQPKLPPAVEIAREVAKLVSPKQPDVTSAPGQAAPPAVNGVRLPKKNQPHLLDLTFKNSPLFTPGRRERISMEMDEFYTYLTAVGFDLPKQIPPLGTHPGNAITMVWTFPLDSIYDAQISIPEGWIDKPDDIRNVYAMWVFRRLFGLLQPLEPAGRQQFIEPMASLFSCYYRSSFASHNVCDHDWVGRSWNNILWEIRTKKGKDFTDSVVFYTYKAWKPSSKPPESFDDFFGLHFLHAVWVKDNRGQDLQDVEKIILHAHGR
ncbi:MAG: hypothetical protein ABSA70_04805 [Terriglobia bacterium]